MAVGHDPDNFRVGELAHVLHECAGRISDQAGKLEGLASGFRSGGDLSPELIEDVVVHQVDALAR